jgi:SAM-dependent methyltransferase
MRYGVIPGNLFERAFIAAGLIPIGLTEGYAPAYGRALLVAADLGVFDAIGPDGASATEVATTCGTDARATEKLLNLLATMRYLQRRDGRFRLARHVRRWLLTDAPASVRDMLRMKRLEWRWIERLDDFVRIGAPIDVHATMSRDDWELYQRGMRAQANVLAPFVAGQIPLPRGATRMLDVGGSHGFFSVALCRKHAALSSVVLDLPEAIEHAAPLLEREQMGDRVTLRAGDALVDDLGAAAYDLILMVSLVHHFDDATNRRLVARAAAALRPGGRLAIVELLRPTSGGGSQMGAFYDLYFALTSQAGLWAADEIRSWQVAAGLAPRKLISPPFARELGIQVAERV